MSEKILDILWGFRGERWKDDILIKYVLKSEMRAEIRILNIY